MFVAIIQFPTIKPGKDADFREWFAWANGELAKERGFIRRLLLQPRDGGNYAAVMEHESLETFRAMHASPGHAQVHGRVGEFFDGSPSSQFYDVIGG